MYYLVKLGDTVSSICDRFELNINSFLKVNRMKIDDVIYPEQIMDVSRRFYEYPKFNTIYKGRNRTINSMIDCLNRQKGHIMYLTDVDSELYNRLAILALGIAGQETNYGWGIRYNIKRLTIPFSNLTLQQVAKKLFRHYSYPSLGLFQHKIEYDFKNCKILTNWYKEYNITVNDLRSDIQKMTIACILRLIYTYKYNTGKYDFYHGITGEKISRMEELLYRYNSRFSQLRNNTCTPELNIHYKGVMKYCSKFIKVL